MKRRSKTDHFEYSETEDATVDEFIKELLEVCEYHGFSIRPDDPQGSFFVEASKPAHDEVLKNAGIGLSLSKDET